MKKKILLAIFIIIGIIAIISLVTKKTEEPPKIPSEKGGEIPIKIKRNYKIGIGPIPRNFPGSSQEDFLDMFDKAKESGEILIAQNEWRDSVNYSGEIPEILQLVEMQKNTYGYTPQFGIMFIQGEDKAILNTNDNPINDWTNNDAKQKYKNVALKICKDYNAKYLALGIEVNTYYLNFGENNFDRFVSAYKEIYDEIKNSCPKTKIFVSFQLEKMKGLGDKTFGKKLEPHWNLIDKFGDKLDLIAFTTYPEIEFDSPDKMPKDYYSEIKKYINKPAAFTEIGWSSADGFSGKEIPDKYSEETQNDFILKFIELTEGLNIEFVNWAFMHDLKTTGPLTKIGLRKSNGAAKKGWSTWTEFKKQKIN